MLLYNYHHIYLQITLTFIQQAMRKNDDGGRRNTSEKYRAETLLQICLGFLVILPKRLIRKLNFTHVKSTALNHLLNGKFLITLDDEPK